MTQPVTPEAYAALRAAIDAGTTAVMTWAKRRKGGCVDFCMPGIQSDLGTLSDLIYTYIPPEMISIVPAKLLAEDLADAPNPPLIPDDNADGRYGWATFADRAQLLEALDKVTSADVRGQLGKLEGPPAPGAEGGWTDALTDGLSWWAVALAAGGVLAWLGRKHIAGFIVSIGVKKMLQALVAGGVVMALAPQALKIIDAAGDAAAASFNVVPYAIGGAVVLGLVVVGVVLLRRPPSRSRLAA